MEKRDRFIAELREAAKVRSLSFSINKKRGKGGHATVYCGDKLTTLPSRDIDPVTAAKIRKQLGLACDTRGAGHTGMRTFSYPAVFEAGKDAGVVVVTFPDVPEAISQGDGETEAREMGADALGVALLGLLSLGRRLPSASKPLSGQITLSVDADVAAKIAVIEAFQSAGITQAELARRLGKDGREVRRILDPDHATKVQSLQAALAALGKRLVIGVEAA